MEAWLEQKARRPGGTTCPTCGKHVQVYRRAFNQRMARTLIYSHVLLARYPGRFLDITNYCIKTHDFNPGDHGKLVWWEMLEQKPGPGEHGSKYSGLWRMTDRGFDFVHNRIKVAKYCIEYRSNPLAFEGPDWSIIDALGKGFSYPELMAQDTSQGDLFP